MDTLILTSLLALMGISTFTSKEFVIFCRVSKIGNVNSMLLRSRIPQGTLTYGFHPPADHFPRGIFDLLGRKTAKMAQEELANTICSATTANHGI